MREIYLQDYFVKNYIFLAIVIGTYFVIFMKSAIDIFIKKKIFLNMTLLLILSIIESYIKYCKEQKVMGLLFIILVIIYYSLKPLIMAIVITVLKPKVKLIYIPIIVNFFFLIYIILGNKEIYRNMIENYNLNIFNYSFIIVNFIYWIIFLLILEQKFYIDMEINRLPVFFCISWLMTATITEIIGRREGILNETYAIIFLFYYLVLHVKISQQVSEEKDIKLREQRMSLMLSQIQPHFLYNTLNTITALCRINPKLAEETTVKFSGYLRKNMHNMGKSDTQPFSKELEHTKIYIDIEKLRFGNRVKVEYDIKTEDFNIPTLTLQPLVENAIKHGICNKIQGGTIKISTEKKEKENIIIIADDGIGFEMETVLNDGKVHIGIQNVKERLKSIANAELEITSFIGIGTTVKIIVPKKIKSIKLEGGKRREILSIGR